MGNTPERIMLSACGKAIVTDQTAFPDDVEYTRSDLIDAIRAEARAEALREAAELVGREAADFPDNVAWCVEDLANAIFALIDTPADPVREAALTAADELVHAVSGHIEGIVMRAVVERRLAAYRKARALAGND